MVSIPDDPIVRSMERTGYPPWVDDDPYEEDDEDEDEDEESTAIIAITQLPEIKENLRALRERWEREAREAASLVCTEESVKRIKEMRAEMRKEFDEADTQRKAVKSRYMAAWEEVEATWCECVAEPYKRADASYRATVEGFENELKARCRKSLEEYFEELCSSLDVDFLTFDQAMALGKIKIGLADAKAKLPKKLMESIRDVVVGVADGIEKIEAMPEEDRAEVMAEYKQCFDVGTAVAAMNGRRRRVRAEREAAEARRAIQERRQAAMDKVEASLPPEPVERPREPERTFDKFTFTVYGCTVSQLRAIREFLNKEGIKYE